MSVEEGQIVLKTEKQEREEMEKKQEEMETRARETAKMMVAEEMKKLVAQMASMKEERDTDK